MSEFLGSFPFVPPQLSGCILFATPRGTCNIFTMVYYVMTRALSLGEHNVVGGAQTEKIQFLFIPHFESDRKKFGKTFAKRSNFLITCNQVYSTGCKNNAARENLRFTLRSWRAESKKSDFLRMPHFVSDRKKLA